MMQNNDFDRAHELGMPAHFKKDGLLYKYLSFEKVEKLITNNTLYFSKAENFNDPFDLISDIIDPSLTADHYKEILKIHRPNYSRRERRQSLQTLRAKEDALIRHMRYKIKKLRDKIGVCCFSQKYDNALMWAHYANSHKGICVGFSIGQNNLMPIHKVKYVEQKSVVNLFDAKWEAILKWCCTKSHIWSYEEEVRIIHMEKNGPVSFNKCCLKEVYFGLKTSADDEKKIRDMLSSYNYTNFDAYKMAVNPQSYDIVRKAF